MSAAISSLTGYGSSSDESDSESPSTSAQEPRLRHEDETLHLRHHDQADMRGPVSAVLDYPISAAPHVQPNASMDPRRHLDPNKKEVHYNPKYDELFAPVLGPVNPNKTQQQAAEKNILSGLWI